jgi:hypothetical protein
MIVDERPVPTAEILDLHRSVVHSDSGVFARDGLVHQLNLAPLVATDKLGPFTETKSRPRTLCCFVNQTKVDVHGRKFYSMARMEYANLPRGLLPSEIV